MKTKIGYFASLEQYKPMDALKQSVRAENVGFDSIWVDNQLPSLVPHERRNRLCMDMDGFGAAGNEARFHLDVHYLSHHPL